MPGPAPRPTRQAVTLRDLVADPSPALVERVYREILRPSFPADELDPLPSVLRELADGRRARMVVAVDTAGDPLATLMAEWYPGSRTLFVGYVAVRPGHRGGGIGSALFAPLARWTAELAPDLVLGEAEDPRRSPAHAPDHDHGDPWARLRLYERFGARALDMPFVQPRLHAHHGPAPRLLLLAVAARGRFLGDSPPESLPAATVRRFVEEYHGRYPAPPQAGATATDDDRYRTMTAWLAAADRIRLVELGRPDRIPDRWG